MTRFNFALVSLHVPGYKATKIMGKKNRTAANDSQITGSMLAPLKKQSNQNSSRINTLFKKMVDMEDKLTQIITLIHDKAKPQTKNN